MLAKRCSAIWTNEHQPADRAQNNSTPAPTASQRKGTNRDVLYLHVAAGAVGRSGCDEHHRGDGLSAVGCVWADGECGAAVRRGHDRIGRERCNMKITLPPLPEAFNAIDEMGKRIPYFKEDQLRAYAAAEVAALTAENARLREELERWKRRYEDLADELTMSRGLMGDT